MRVRHSVGIAAAIVLCSVVQAEAQDAGRRDFLFAEPQATLTVFGAFAAPSARSDLYQFSFDELTLGRGDLVSVSHGLDLAIRIHPRWDVVAGVAFARGAHRSEFRDFVDQDDQPIEQTTTLSRVPIGASLRYHITPRGQMIGSRAWIPARFSPWVGVGGGAMQYRFSQRGDFVDYDTFNVFSDQFTTRGWAPFAQGSLGLGWSLNRVLQLTGEARYVHARGANGDDFVGFERIDLSGLSSAVGLTIRF
jgi:hypothetical protein